MRITLVDAREFGIDAAGWVHYRVAVVLCSSRGDGEGLPKSVFDDLQAQLAANRSKFYGDLLQKRNPQDLPGITAWHAHGQR